MNISFSELEKQIDYYFKNKEYIYEALSHSSYANEKKKQRKSNERLEFLGDSILSNFKKMNQTTKCHLLER
ncbi:MAG: hypothetical protein K2J88_01860, partial [Oscillospiraceae bacterium]|nr:hypothetical protein [Oscillospiraceae bacterium]